VIREICGLLAAIGKFNRVMPNALIAATIQGIKNDPQLLLTLVGLRHSPLMTSRDDFALRPAIIALQFAE
jgi:hypothetical protein